MSESVAYLNGEWLPRSRAGLPLHDAGFVMGVTIVDFIRTFRHQVYAGPKHVARFQANVADAGFSGWKHSDAELSALAGEIVARNSGNLTANEELALIMFATPGPMGVYLGEPEVNGPPTLGMHTFPLAFERYRGLICDGATLRACETVVMPTSPWIPPSLKHRSRMHWWLAELELQRQGDAAKPLLLDAAGRVTETSFANLVIVKGREVISPRRDAVLPGVSLETVAELCPEVGLSFREDDVTLADCFAADEVLLCGSAFCLARARQINDIVLPTGDAVLRMLSAAWSRRLGVDFREQIVGSG